MITLSMNEFGHILLYYFPKEYKKIVPVQTAKYLHNANGKISYVYIQAESDVDYIRENLSTNDWRELEKGYLVYLKSGHLIEEIYFRNEV